MDVQRKLVIHIGNHKTATTSIQRALFANRAHLRKQGFELFSQNPDGSLRRMGNIHPWIIKEPGSRRVIRADLPDVLGALTGNVILSSELFSWVFNEHEIRKFQAGLAKYFGQICIVSFLRRQDQHVISHYQQASRKSRFYAAEFYAQGNKALPPFRDHYYDYLDYNRRIGIWANAFGESSMLIRLFETSELKNGDAVDDFFAAVDLEILDRPRNENESHGFEVTKVNHLMNHRRVKQFIQKQLIRHLDNSGKCLPSRKQAEIFYNYFRQSNKLLNQRFAISAREYLFSEDFDMYPEAPADLWTEDSANQAILHLLEGIKEVPLVSVDEIALLEDCVRALASEDPKTSFQLAELVGRLQAK
jgi:hypothetical protein